jgi:hypothetical protein
MWVIFMRLKFRMMRIANDDKKSQDEAVQQVIQTEDATRVDTRSVDSQPNIGEEISQSQSNSVIEQAIEEQEDDAEDNDRVDERLLSEEEKVVQLFEKILKDGNIDPQGHATKRYYERINGITISDQDEKKWFKNGNEGYDESKKAIIEEIKSSGKVLGRYQGTSSGKGNAYIWVQDTGSGDDRYYPSKTDGVKIIPQTMISSRLVTREIIREKRTENLIINLKDKYSHLGEVPEDIRERFESDLDEIYNKVDDFILPSILGNTIVFQSKYSNIEDFKKNVKEKVEQNSFDIRDLSGMVTYSGHVHNPELEKVCYIVFEEEWKSILRDCNDVDNLLSNNQGKNWYISINNRLIQVRKNLRNALNKINNFKSSKDVVARFKSYDDVHGRLRRRMLFAFYVA